MSQSAPNGKGVRSVCGRAQPFSQLTLADSYRGFGSQSSADGHIPSRCRGERVSLNDSGLEDSKQETAARAGRRVDAELVVNVSV